MSLRPAVFLREAFSLALLVLIALAMATPAAAEKGKLLTRLTPEMMAVVFPGAERLGPEEGTPPAIAAYKDGKIAAYIFSTSISSRRRAMRPRRSTSLPGSI